MNPTSLPTGACNAHCHVFGPRDRFPYPPDGSFVPKADAPKEALFALNDRLGLQRCVIVHSSCHGLDNAATEDAIASRPKDYRGVALAKTSVSDAELKRLDAAGFRGVRFHYMGHLGKSTPIEEVIAFGRRLEPLGWHLQLHGDPQQILIDFASELRRTVVPIVIDHIGRIDASLGLEQPHFKGMLSLMEDERFWVKVSGSDRITKQGPPYDDAIPFAKKLVDEFGDRVVWGNDWPHPNHAEANPDDQKIFDTIERMAPTLPAREKLMVTNPAHLYRFGD
jgi:2-pyrone-4,6-dicarboxylate lactonase